MRDLPGLPLEGLTEEQQRTFDQGDELFDLALRPYDGLGPLYTRAACSQCHAEDARGPGAVTKMVLVESDGVTPRADQSALAYGHTARPLTEAGATTPIAPPSGLLGLKLSYRVGPSVLSACAAAPVPRPPQPISPIRSSSPPWPCVAKHQAS
jgi:hypothetical protein